jgi:hypothetical protein
MGKKHGVLCVTCALTICLIVSPRMSKADTVYSNFAPSQSFDARCCGVDVELNTSHESQAMPFTPSGNFTLTEIDLALAYIDGVNDVTVTLNANSSGQPGSVIESWNNVTSQTGWLYFYTQYTPEALLSSPGVLLNAGQQYWVVVTAGGSDTDVAWNWNSTGDSGTYETYSFYYGWVTHSGTRGAYDVLGTSTVPEPGTMLLLGSGLASLIGLRRRRAAA